MKRLLSLLIVALVGLINGAQSVCAEELKPIALPAPRMEGGKPLMQALKDRQSIREFSPTALPPQLMADLLWAGFGINRPEIAHRTAPSAMNSQEVDIYVALTQGVYLYDAKGNQLVPVAATDVREQTGRQEFVKVAPVALIFVADFVRMVKPKPEDKDRYATFDTGYISQNVYLFCASAGLATVVHELDRERKELREAMKLKPEQKIIIAQTVGYPKTAPR